MNNKKIVKYQCLSYSNILNAHYPTVDIIEILFISYLFTIFSYCSITVVDSIFYDD